MADPSPALVAIYLRPGARHPTVEKQSALAVADVGLDGDHAHGGKRQVTLLSLESWRLACAELGRDLEPSIRRANLLVSGLQLESSIGGVITIGEVVLDILGETRPCELIDDGGRTGLQQALRPQRRGGVYGRIRSGGKLTVGMECRLSLPPPS